jgi:hypothetical protein
MRGDSHLRNRMGLMELMGYIKVLLLHLRILWLIVVMVNGVNGVNGVN